MPHVTRIVPSSRLSAQAIRDLYEAFAVGRRSASSVTATFTLQREDERWEFERAADFFAAVDGGPCDARLHEVHDDSFLEVRWSADEADVTVHARRPDLGDVELLLDQLTTTDGSGSRRRPLRVFLGHGRDHQWRALRDHLLEHGDIEILTYENHASAGDPATVVLERIVQHADAAVVLFTAELREDEGWRYAVPNVIHETGLFQGRLGWGRTLIVREDSCRAFANTAGLTEVRFPNGHVRESFGDVVAFLRRTPPRSAM